MRSISCALVKYSNMPTSNSSDADKSEEFVDDDEDIFSASKASALVKEGDELRPEAYRCCRISNTK